MITLTQLATRIAAGVVAAIPAEQAAAKTLSDAINSAAKLMEGFESAYANVNASGGTKLAGVVAGVAADLALAPDALATVSVDLTAFCSAVKTTWNVLTGSVETPAVTDAAAATPSATNVAVVDAATTTTGAAAVAA